METGTEGEPPAALLQDRPFLNIQGEQVAPCARSRVFPSNATIVCHTLEGRSTPRRRAAAGFFFISLPHRPSPARGTARCSSAQPARASRPVRPPGIRATAAARPRPRRRAGHRAGRSGGPRAGRRWAGVHPRLAPVPARRSPPPSPRTPPPAGSGGGGRAAVGRGGEVGGVQAW